MACGRLQSVPLMTEKVGRGVEEPGMEEGREVGGAQKYNRFFR